MSQMEFVQLRVGYDTGEGLRKELDDSFGNPGWIECITGEFEIEEQYNYGGYRWLDDHGYLLLSIEESGLVGYDLFSTDSDDGVSYLVRWRKGKGLAEYIVDEFRRPVLTYRNYLNLCEQVQPGPAGQIELVKLVHEWFEEPISLGDPAKINKGGD